MVLNEKRAGSSFNIYIYLFMGRKKMKYKIIDKQAFALYGKKELINPENSAAEILELWNNHYATGRNKIIRGRYGICFSDEFGSDISFCIADEYTEGCTIPDDCQLLEFEAGSFAVFEGQGAIPNSVIELSQEIFSLWIGEQKEYEISDYFNIEFYSDSTKYEKGVLDDNYKFEIWVPVMKKD